MQSITLKDPREAIWGFHVHQELPEEYFSDMLQLQTATKQYLQTRGVTPDFEDVFRPGYGPHINPMWELRVERQPKETVLEHFGAAVAFMAVNRGNFPSAYVHATMHDESLPGIQQLRQEGETNQKNAIWFGQRVTLKDDFFFNPPLTPDGAIVDTRTAHTLSVAERDEIRARGKPIVYRKPEDVVIRGFHIHVDFQEADRAKAYYIFDQFVIYLLQNGLRPSSTRLYGAGENGPHVLPGWEVKFEYRSGIKNIEAFGVALGWLVCNRNDFDVFCHGVSWEEGNLTEELYAHQQYIFFIGNLPPLRLQFFQDLIDRAAAAQATKK